MTPQRIDDFIKRKLNEAIEADASGIIDSSNRAAALLLLRRLPGGSCRGRRGGGIE